MRRRSTSQPSSAPATAASANATQGDNPSFIAISTYA